MVGRVVVGLAAREGVRHPGLRPKQDRLGRVRGTVVAGERAGGGALERDPRRGGVGAAAARGARHERGHGAAKREGEKRLQRAEVGRGRAEPG